VRTFRATYRDRQGQSKESARWYVEFRDHRERLRRLPAFSGRAESEELGRRIEDLVSAKGSGGRLGRDLARFVEGLPHRTRKRLAQIGLLDARDLAGSRQLLDLLAEYVEALQARKRSPQYVSFVRSTVERVCRGAGFVYWTDLDGGVLEQYLAALRADGASAKTSNGWLGAMRSFVRWCLVSGYGTGSDPFVTVQPVNAALDRRRIRRALSVDELRTLIERTRTEPPRHGLDGPTRSLLYRFAAETGLRRSEIRSLRVRDFVLDGEAPCVQLQASHSKGRRDEVLPLRAELAASLSEHLSGRLPTAAAFRVPKRTAEMLTTDLRAAGIDEEDASGRIADFHSLRVSFVTALVRSGASPKLVQTLARHSDPRLTFNTYTRLGLTDARQAIEGLPSLDPSQPAALSPTGTAGMEEATSLNRNVLASCLAFAGDPQCPEVPRMRRRPAPGDAERASERPGRVSAPGLEPGTYWLKASCSTD